MTIPLSKEARHPKRNKYVNAIDDARAEIVGIDRFGESALAGVLFQHFGFTVEHIVTAVSGRSTP